MPNCLWLGMRNWWRLHSGGSLCISRPYLLTRWSTMPDMDVGQSWTLPRGGHCVMTKAGTVQVGIPPETIKDSMKLGYAFASHLVVPEVFFDRATGIGCDFEFPTYASKFMGGKKITFICTTNVKKRIQAIFHETLLGGRDLRPTAAVARHNRRAFSRDESGVSMES